MNRPLRFVQVGTGGMGRYWCSDVFTHLRAQGKAEVVAAVDIVEEHLANAHEFLGLGSDRCYTDLTEALSRHEADAVAIIVPPSQHEMVVDAALEYDLHILSEKPIADSMESSCRIARKVEAANRKMCITMSHRFDQDKLTLADQIGSGRYGPLSYLVHRFTHNCREFGSWGEFRHRMADPMMIEGAVHHFEIHRALSRSDAATIYASSWNPPWGEYAGDSTVLAIIEMANGTRVHYEAAKANASTLNGWGNDYIRAECERATVELDARAVRILQGGMWDPPTVQDEPLLAGTIWMNPLLAEMFCDWVSGDREDHPTEVSRSLQSAAMVFAAIDSARTRTVVDVQAFLRSHL